MYDYALFLDYYNYLNNHIIQWVPMFDDLDSCTYWGRYLKYMLTEYHNVKEVIWGCTEIKHELAL